MAKANLLSRISAVVVVSSILFVSGCSLFGEEETAPAISKTGVGAATGAALGAGLGAIVGSASGSAGEGLVIGSAAGAVTGGLIGSQFERQDELLANQKEISARHGEQLEEQGRQLQELKDGRFEIPTRNKSSKESSAKRQQTLSKSNTRPTATLSRADTREKVRARMEQPKAEPSKKSRAETPVFDTSKAEKTRALNEKKQPSAVTPAKSVSSTESLKPKKEVLGGLPPAVVSSEETDAAVAAPVKTVKSEQKANSPRDANCTEAEGEIARARNASSDADKLFYYRRAARLCPKEPSYHVEMGKVFNTIGRKEDAKFEFNKAIELDPENNLAQDELSVMQLDTSN